MKKIKYITLSFIFCFFSNISKSQYSVAGIHGSIYVDIIPDTLINSTGPWGDEYYYVDINQDGVQDIKMHSYYYASSGSFNMSGIDVSSLDTLSTLFSVSKAFNAGDTINNTVTTYVKSGKLYWWSASQTGTSQSNLPWGNAPNQFIGVKYQASGNTIFGWIRVKVNGNSIIIREYSLGAPLVGIENFLNTNELSIYPNPANNIINVELKTQNENAEIKITNLFGEQIALSAFGISPTGEKTIDVSSLQNGIYFVSVKTNEGLCTKKIVVQH